MRVSLTQTIGHSQKGGERRARVVRLAGASWSFTAGHSYNSKPVATV